MSAVAQNHVSPSARQAGWPLILIWPAMMPSSTRARVGALIRRLWRGNPSDDGRAFRRLNIHPPRLRSLSARNTRIAQYEPVGVT